MQYPLVSIIIPNYNHAKFLNQRIDSILRQTYTNYEIIILDDMSKDNSVDIIKQYQDNKHISHVIINKENSGSPFKQWKKGFDLATGELIWIAESDDTCKDSLLETLVSEFQKDERCSVAFCKSIKIDTNNNPIGEEGLRSHVHMDGLRFIKKHLSKYNYIANASSAVFKKSVLKNTDWSFTNYHGCGDWVMWIEIASSGNVAYCNTPLNYFRIHSSNTTKKQAFNGQNEIEGANVYKYMLKKNYISYKEELRARLSHIYSIRYGKQHTFYSDSTRKELLNCWRTTPIISCFLWIIYIIQKYTGIQIIKR